MNSLVQLSCVVFALMVIGAPNGSKGDEDSERQILWSYFGTILQNHLQGTTSYNKLGDYSEGIVKSVLMAKYLKDDISELTNITPQLKNTVTEQADYVLSCLANCGSTVIWLQKDGTENTTCSYLKKVQELVGGDTDGFNCNYIDPIK